MAQLMQGLKLRDQVFAAHCRLGVVQAEHLGHVGSQVPLRFVPGLATWGDDLGRGDLPASSIA